jgi:hypothetical protein
MTGFEDDVFDAVGPARGPSRTELKAASSRHRTSSSKRLQDAGPSDKTEPNGSVFGGLP